MTYIGLDVGWSPIRESCSMAIYSDETPIAPPITVESWTRYHNGNVYILNFRYPSRAFLQSVRQQYSNAIVVVDGPLIGRYCANDRVVDKLFRRRPFYGYCSTYKWNASYGRFYSAANTLIQQLGFNHNEYDDGCIGNEGWSIYETNPTAIMTLFFDLAVLQNAKENGLISSRNNPVEHRFDELGNIGEWIERGALNSKSDCYWTSGVNQDISKILAEPAIIDETNHERIASLFCLAMAKLLGDGQACLIGDLDEGVYTSPIPNYLPQDSLINHINNQLIHNI